MKNIFKTLEVSQQMYGQVDASSFILALVASVLSAFFVAWLYHYFYEHRGTGSQVHRAFPLLGISVTTLFIGVQLSLPLSLGLLGALSIIRFRTPIKEPEEVGFIMLVIACSISCATFNFILLELLLLIAVLTLLLTRGWHERRRRKQDGIMILSLAPEKMADLAALCDYVRQHTRSYALESSSTRDGTASLQFSFSGLRKSLADFQTEIKKLSEIKAIHIFLNRPGGIR